MSISTNRARGVGSPHLSDAERGSRDAETMILSAFLLLLSLLVHPGLSMAERARPEPESVYRQLRHEPVIRTREQALEYLAQASPDDLRRSAKTFVDGRIRTLLRHEVFGSLDRETQDALDVNVLKIRSSFWTRDLDELAEGRKDLRELLDSGKIVATAEQDTPEWEFWRCVLGLLGELERALALQECTRSREVHDWDAATLLECLLRGGPGG